MSHIIYNGIYYYYRIFCSYYYCCCCFVCLHLHWVELVKRKYAEKCSFIPDFSRIGNVNTSKNGCACYCCCDFLLPQFDGRKWNGRITWTFFFFINIHEVFVVHKMTPSIFRPFLVSFHIEHKNNKVKSTQPASKPMSNGKTFSLRLSNSMKCSMLYLEFWIIYERKENIARKTETSTTNWMPSMLNICSCNSLNSENGLHRDYSDDFIAEPRGSNLWNYMPL